MEVCVIHKLHITTELTKFFLMSNNKTIRWWDSNTGEQIGQPWTGHTDWISSLSLSPDGTLLASLSFDKTVRFWDTTLGRPVGQHLQHNTSVYSVCFSPSGDIVASGGNDVDVYLWWAPWLDSSESQVMHASDLPRYPHSLFSTSKR